MEELPTAAGELIRAQIVLLNQEAEESLKDFSDRVDQVLKIFPRSRVIAVMSTRASNENLEGTQNKRVIPLSQTEFFSSLKFEYLCLYMARAEYVPIEVGELFPMTTMTFPAYVRMSLNQRYLTVTYPKMVLSDDRYHRLGQASGLYIRGKDARKYQRYVNDYFDTSGKALKKRARALFISICYASLLLNEYVLFDFKTMTAAELLDLHQNIEEMGKELLSLMATSEDLWDVLRESLQGEFYLYWRSPWIAVYAMLISLKSQQGDPLVCLMAGLCADLGLYDLEESVVREYLFSEKRAVSEGAQSSFAKHPMLSLNRCLIKGFPISEAVKSVVVCTHERADEKGFPNQVPAEKLPVEAQILMFSEKIDQGVLTTMKNTGVGFRFLKEKIWESEKTKGGAFSEAFLNSMSEALL